MGINLRKEAQKFDIKQFDSNDVNHIEPVLAAVRPPTGMREQPEQREEEQEDELGAQKQKKREPTVDPKEQKRMIHNHHRAWKRIRPETMNSAQEADYADAEEPEDGTAANPLPAIKARRPTTRGVNSRTFSMSSTRQGTAAAGNFFASRNSVRQGRAAALMQSSEQITNRFR